MKKGFLIFIIFLTVALGIYMSGPKPETPVLSKAMPIVPNESSALEAYIASNESKHPVRPGNEARIVWSDSTKKKTQYSVVYLHGFFASEKEGDPVHRDFAKEFGCNLYLARLADHGVDTVDQLINFTVDRGWESAKQALAIGKALGEKVILMSTSSGGTFALLLAAEYPDDVDALINMSPNIRINHPVAFVANDPWGLQIGRMVEGGKFHLAPSDSIRRKYWYEKFRLEAIAQLQELLEEKMNANTFNKIHCPSLTLYYFKNETEQDPQVKVSSMLDMHKELGTPDSLKVSVAMPNAGAHVLGSPLASKDVEGVYREIRKFAIEKMQLTSLNQ